MIYLCDITGRGGVTIVYRILDHYALNPKPNTYFLDDYIAMAPLNIDSFTIDTNDVHTYLIKCIAGNETAEAKIKLYDRDNNG